MPTTQSLAKRRSAAFVTKNACLPCRKKRAKCDGEKPCGRCATQPGIICEYEVSSRLTKEAMRGELKALQGYRHTSEHVFSALASGYQSPHILESLKNGAKLEEISKYLDENGYPRSATRYGSQDSGSVPSLSHTEGSPSMGWPRPADSARDADAEDVASTSAAPESSIGDNDVDMDTPYDVSQWTTVTTDVALLERLMASYFCWEYPIFANISKAGFIHDYSKGRERYCSSFLVNSILALGCRFLHRSENPVDPEIRRLTAGDLFSREAERLLALEHGRPSLVTVQGLGILSTNEASCGTSTKSWEYSRQSIRMAVEMGLHLPVSQEISSTEKNVRTATFWGAFSLDQFWSLNVGRLPLISRYSISVEKPIIVEDQEQEEWAPYTDGGTPQQQKIGQASNVRSVCKAIYELSEIINNSQYVLYGPRDSVMSKLMLASYSEYLAWYDSLPVVLRLGSNSTPSVLFTHMCYHFALLLFFRPFIRLRFVDSNVVPREVCLEAANAISSLVRAYRQLYTLHRTPALVPYMAFSSSIIHLINAGSESSPLTSASQVMQDIADLDEMAQSHTCARRARQILVRMADNWTVSNAQIGYEPTTKAADDEECVPLSSSMNFFCPDMECELPNPSRTDNPLFSPFPAQGTPLLARGKDLETTGFKFENA